MKKIFILPLILIMMSLGSLYAQTYVVVSATNMDDIRLRLSDGSGPTIWTYCMQPQNNLPYVGFTYTFDGTYYFPSNPQYQIVKEYICSITVDSSPFIGACNPSTNTYSVSGYVSFSNPPSTGTLTVSDGLVSKTYYPPFSVSNSYSLTGITADGGYHTITATFSDANCSSSTTYTAPQSCAFTPCSISSITATPGACNSSTNTYYTSGYVYFSNPPGTGSLTVSDGTASQTFYAPFTSPLAYTLTGISANGSTHTVNASFSAASCSNTTTYTAPESCAFTPCSISFVTATPGACNASTNTYSTSGYVYFSNPPSTGTLTVSDGTASQTLYPPFTSPMAYTLTGITANGSTHTVNASFSATNCSNSSTYTAPQSCSIVPSCSISSVTATPGACNSSTNTYSMSGSIYFSNPPGTGTLTVSDGTASQTFYAPFTSPLSYTLTGITANGSMHTVTASFSATNCSNTTTYTAPASCAVSNCTVSLTAIPGICDPSTNTYSVSGRATIFNARGGSTITFTDGAVSQSYTVPSSQVSTTWVDYTLSDFTSNGNSHTVTAVVSNGASCLGTVTYNAPASCLCTNPTPSVNNPTICAGNSATLTVSNCAGTVSWNDGTTGATRTVSPTFTTSYTATCSVGTCTGTASGTVTVIASPTPSVNNSSICSGNSATLTVSNCAGTVTWNDGMTGATRTVSPTFTTSYTATCSVGTCTGTASGTVTVTTASNPTPSVNSPTICAGSSATLSVSNCAGTVSWNDGTTGSTKTVSPTTTASYTATCSVSTGNCTGTGTATATVTVTSASTPSVNSPTICAGNSATLTVSNCAGTVSWNDGVSGATRSVSPSSTASYTATCSVGSCTGTATGTVTVTTAPNPTPSVNSPSICTGSSATLIVSNCAGTVSWNDGTTGLAKTVSPTTTTSYTATCSVTIGNCSGTGTATGTVTVTPKPTPSVNSPTICAGNSATLMLSNCAGTVNWNDGVSGATRSVSPSSTTSYTATCSVGSCTGTATGTVTVIASPTPSVNNSSICSGNSATLTVSNCAGTVTWNDGMTGATRTVSPMTTTTYTATCNVGTCTGTASGTVTVTTASNPTPSVNSLTICEGSSATLSVSNCAGTVSWNDGMTGATKTVSPTGTTSYTATCSVTIGNCTGTGTATGTVTVTPKPTPSPSVNSPTICSGSSAVLTVSNCAGTVSWNDGTTGLTKTVSPSSTTSYTATCSVSTGNCSGTGTATGTVTVTPQPTPSVNSPTVCTGNSATLTVSNCAGTVSWNDGTTGATKTVSPTATTTYTATCSVGSCTGTATATVTVTTASNPTPSVNSPTICAGSSATLTVSNCAGTVSWNDGTTGLTKTVSPSATTFYTATCSVSTGSCSGTGTATATVTVTPQPTPSVNSPTICTGSSATLTVSNCAGTVSWNDGTTGLTKTVSPTATTTYTATCSVGSCTGTATSTVTVTTASNPTPSVNSPTICSGSSATLTVSNCAGTVNWNDGTTGLTKTVSPTTTTTYTATCSVSTGSCSGTGTATATVTVTPKPTPSPSVNSPTICSGSSAVLTVSNCTGTVSWNDGTTGSTKTVSPTATTTYTATCTEGTAPCTGNGTATATVTVTPKPTPTVNSPSICAGNSVTLTVSNCAGTVSWNDGTTGATKTVSPSATTTYTATCSAGTCTGSATSTVTVTPVPAAGTPSVTQATCNAAGTAANNDAGISITGITNANVYSYTADGSTPAFANATALSGGAINLTNLANPASAVTYKFRLYNTSADCYTEVSAILNPKSCTPSCSPPSPTGTGTSVCTGNSATLYVTGCTTTYPAVWYSNAALTAQVGTGNSFTTPVLTGSANYYAACVKDAGCKSNGIVITAMITPLPVAGIPSVAQATCNAAGTAANNDAGISITDITNATVYAYTTDGSVPAFANATALSGGAIHLTNLVNPASVVTYKFRLFNTSADCYTEVTAILNPKNCNNPKGSLGDFVWKDINNNGIQDESTPNAGGVAGVQIELYKNGVYFAKDTTDFTGHYLFTNLDAGTYKIKVLSTSIPAGCEISSVKDAPNDDTKDSDVDKTTGFSGDYVIDPTDPTKKDILTVDAALAVSCVKSKVTLTGAPVCSADVQTYSISFSVTGKNGILKVSKGTLSGSNPYTVTGIPSGASIKITDSLSAICKFDTLISALNCNCNPSLPTLLTPSLTVCIGDTFPTLKASVVGLATVEWFATATSTTVLFNGLNYKPAGTVPAVGASFYAQARSTDPSCPAAISTGRVMATINAQDCNKEVDLALKKSINTKIAQIGDILTYTLKVWNESGTNATGVEVTDSLASTVQFQTGSFTASRGSVSITGNVIKWVIGNIAAAGVPANGDTVTLTYRVKATQEGVHFNTAEICKTKEQDVDSTPCNNNDEEDDIDRQCFTVPFKLCPSEQVQVGVPSTLTNVQWFKDGNKTPIASGNVVMLAEVGTYTFTATNQSCPAGGCCPIIIEAGTNCCPAELCIPFIITKRKK